MLLKILSIACLFNACCLASSAAENISKDIKEIFCRTIYFSDGATAVFYMNKRLINAVHKSDRGGELVQPLIVTALYKTKERGIDGDLIWWRATVPNDYVPGDYIYDIFSTSKNGVETIWLVCANTYSSSVGLYKISDGETPPNIPFIIKAGWSEKYMYPYSRIQYGFPKELWNSNKETRVGIKAIHGFGHEGLVVLAMINQNETLGYFLFNPETKRWNSMRVDIEKERASVPSDEGK